MGRTIVGILVGGNSIEREVSFKSAEKILNNIDIDKYETRVFELPKDEKDISWVKELVNNPPDVVLSALHGGKGENGSVQGLLHCMNIPYVGSKVLGSALCMDKYISKQIMRNNHIPVVDELFYRRGDNIEDIYEEIGEMGYPMIVKPNRGGSSIGIKVVNNIDELYLAVNEIVERYDDDVLIEKYISAREITCGVLESAEGLKVMAVLDINSKGEIYDYISKYEDEEIYSRFSNLPEYMQTMIKEIAKKAFVALKCSGYGCVDMLVSEEQVYVIEINTLPGLTEHSLIPKAVERVGISFKEFLSELIENERKKSGYAVNKKVNFKL